MESPQDNLFVRLINHRLSDDRTRHEDYLTECFAWLLAQDHELTRDLLRPGGLMFSGSGEVLAPNTKSMPQIETQVSLSRHDRPDIVIKGDEFLLIIEAKVDAPYNSNQVHRYLKHARGCSRGSVLSVLPAKSMPNIGALPDDDRFLGVLTWESIGGYLATVADNVTTPYRRWFHRLLEHYELLPIEGALMWENQDGIQDVATTKKLCKLFDNTAGRLRDDSTVSLPAPTLYRQPGGRLRLVTGSQVSAKGPPPRPVLQHNTTLASRYGQFLELRISVFFKGSSSVRASKGVNTCIQLCQWGWKGKWTKDSLSLMRPALGRALPEDDEAALQILNELHEPFMQRCERVLERFIGLLKDGPLPTIDNARPYRDWALNIAVTRTEWLCPLDAEVEEVAHRYDHLLRAILEAFFAAGPEIPLAFLALDAATASL